MKKGEWFHAKSCKHVKNHLELASRSWQTIAQQVANGIVGKKERKVM
jgi:hypothetical protein